MDVRAAVVGAEGDDLGRNRDLQGAQLSQGLTLYNGPVEWLLIHEQSGLGQGVFGHVRITVEMVGRDVEQNRDGRTEKSDGLELKRAYFKSEKIKIPGLRRHGTNRPADIARGERLEMMRRQHAFDQFRGRRLAVGPGNRDVQAQRIL